MIWRGCGNGNSRKFFGARLGKSSKLGYLLLELDWWKVPISECLFLNREKGYSFLCTRTTWNWLARNRTSIQCGKYWWNKLISENQPRFLTTFIWWCTQQECETSRDIVGNCRTMFESRISTGATEKLPGSEKSDANISTWSFDMKGHAKKCVKRCCELANEQLSNFSKFQLHALMTINSKKNNWDLWESCQKYDLKLSWNVYIWHTLVDLILCGQSTNLHDQSQNGPKPVTNAWIDWSLTFISQVNTNSIVMWVIPPSNADWDCFKTLTLPGSWRFEIDFRRNVVYFWQSHTCSWKLGVLETDFSLTEFDGIWLLKCYILPPKYKRNQERARGDLHHTKPSNKHTNTQTKTRIQNEDLELSNVDCISSNVKSSRSVCRSSHF